ncbi:MAG: TetR/AcrR family transcriptional regulator [Cyanobacteria bacterium P01_D01_bin.105]
MADNRTSKDSRAQEIMDVAQDMIQTRGYNGFSYRDIANEIGIKSASIHYHFPGKGQLGRAVTARYCDNFMQALRALEAQSQTNTQALLRGYVELYRTTLIDSDRLCLCGMLAGEAETVPDEVKQEVRRFFKEQHQWLTKTIEQGLVKKDILSNAQTTASKPTDAATWATTILSTLEGAMFVARGFSDSQQFNIAADHLLKNLFE